MLIKRRESSAARNRLSDSFASVVGGSVNRRTFLKRSGVTVGGVALASVGGTVAMRKASARPTTPTGEVSFRKTICTHCSVGCTVTAEVVNGVWVGQEPAFDSPINLGAHCAKGAAVREHAHGDRRLKYPMKLENGKYKRISWDQAIQEVGDRLLKIRETSGPDAVYWMGSAKYSNEQAILLRKFAALWGTNNVDHQARICHSTTVAGVAQSWGYGAMTNSYNDIHNSKLIFFIGSNAAEAHPVSMLHIMKGKENNNAPVIVCDPRFTRTAAHADEHVRLRPGTDIALIWGLVNQIFELGLEDKEFIRQRVWGMDEIRAEAAKWTPEETERVTGVPAEQIKRVARLLGTHKPGTVIWCMGITQHTVGSANTRALCILQLVLGNMGKAGGGTNIFRGHDNVQGATDMGLDVTTLPAYYGLTEAAWKHWCRVWEIDYNYMLSRFESKEMMEAKGIPLSRWFDGVNEDPANIKQRSPIKAMVYWGHAPNSQTRQPELKRGMENLDTLVIIDPYPTVSASLHDRKDGVYLLPAATQFECEGGSRTASNRSLQWQDQIIKPLFESKQDHEIMYLLAQKFGYADQLCKNIKVVDNKPDQEDILREINRGCWTIGYTGQSPERLKLHMQHQHTFDKTTLRANGGPCDGEYYGLPWPCWGTAETKHPGTPNLYDTSKHVMDGGLNFRALFVERNGESLLTEDSYPLGAEIKTGHPAVSYGMLKKLGWDADLTEAERATIEKIGGDKADAINFANDLSGGIQRVALKHGVAPFGNAKARAVVWNFPDPVPQHREPLYTPRRDLLDKYATYPDKVDFRLPMLYKSVQDRDVSKDFPIVLTSGRLVEYEGGGDETRSNPWLAELQPEMFIEINTFDANNANVRHGDTVWVYGPENGKVKVKAFVTERVGKGVAFMPFHFGGHFQGQDNRHKYPEGADPIILGESTNTAQTYGYDPVTSMQESKVTLCRIEKA